MQQPAKTVKGVEVVKKAAHEKAKDAKAAEEAATKKAKEKAAEKRATTKKAIKKATHKKATLDEATSKGPLETQKMRPSDQVCQRDLETRSATEPSKEPPHDCNDDLRGRDLQDELENLLEEEELYDDDSSPGKEMEANEVEERPRDGPQQGTEGPNEVLLQEWPHHEDMGYTDEPSKQGSARRAKATIDDDKEEQPEGITEPKAATELRATPEPPN